MYFYPMYIDDELIDTIAQSPRIVPYLDMPLQHINDQMLRRMARRVTRAETEELLDRLRKPDPEAGAPDHADYRLSRRDGEQFDELCDFVDRQRFERLGVFAYSLRAGHAGRRACRITVDPERAEQRRETADAGPATDRLRMESATGRAHLDVILDAPVPGQPQAWIGRSYADAPDVDGVVYVTGEGLAAGQIVALRNCREPTSTIWSPCALDRAYLL